MSLAVSGDRYGAGSGIDGYKTASKFIPDIFSGKLAVKFYINTCLTEICNSDWEGEINDVGDKVTIRSIPTITISDYQKGMTLSSQVPSSTPLDLLIDKGKYWQVVVDDVDKVQSDIRLFETFADDATQQMKITVENNVFAGIASASATYNFGTNGGALSQNIALGTSGTPLSVSSTNAISFIVDMGQVLDEQNVPDNGRWLVIPAGLAARIKKSDLKDASVTGDSASILRNGRLGTIDRFTVFTSNNLPLSGGKYTCYAGTRDAISFASQITKVETLRAQTTFGDIMRGLNVFGYKVTKPEALATAIVTLA